MIGKTISHYQIIEEIGRGGMGTVYKAKDTKLDRFVALKFLPHHLSRDEETKKRFVHEAKAASALDHPNICNVYEINQTEAGQMFIAMACYEGESLKEKIEHGSLSVTEALNIVSQIANGLEKTHTKGIVHRDVKPANILITEDGVVKIVDFGLAKLIGKTILTKQGTTLGTVAYMSPEQTEGKPVDQRSDIWAVGVMLYEMLAGRRPFRGDYEQAVIYSILNEEPQPLGEINPEVPEELERIISRALSKMPGDRYKSMRDFEQDFESLTWREPTSVRTSGRHLVMMKNLSAVVFLLFLIVFLSFHISDVCNWILSTDDASASRIKLAVLPFTNLTGDTNQDYLADGFTQEMIIKLGQLHPENLSIIARSSVLRYKDGNTPIDQIGDELGVAYILEGSTRRQGQLINISAELVRVKDQIQLWGQTYTRKLSGILTLQREVAQQIAEALSFELLPDEQSDLARSQKVNPEVYEAYLKGSYHWKKLTPEGINTAKQYFELALDKDSTYAPAYKGLAWVWIVRQQMGLIAPKIAGPRAKKAATRAIEIDEAFAGAHEALAVVKTWVDWDWKSARQSWIRTIKLNPNAANAHAYYAHFLAITGHTDQAVIHSKRAVELDPFNALFQAMHGMVLCHARCYNDAMIAAQIALGIQPNLEAAYAALNNALLGKGKLKEARKKQVSLQREKRSGDPEWKKAFESGMTEGGYKEAQRRIAELLAKRYNRLGWKGDNVRAIVIANRYYDAGDKEETVDWLEKAYKERDPNLLYVVRNPIYCDTLCSEPRFRDLLSKMNLPVNN